MQVTGRETAAYLIIAVMLLAFVTALAIAYFSKRNRRHNRFLKVDLLSKRDRPKTGRDRDPPEGPSGLT